jgi:hypothetical protein
LFGKIDVEGSARERGRGDENEKPDEHRGVPRRETGSNSCITFDVMDALTAFGLFAVTAMLVCYTLEQRSTWFILAFAGSCGLGSVYGFLQGAWPFGLVEAIWALVALRRWHYAGYTRNSRQGFRRAR